MKQKQISRRWALVFVTGTFLSLSPGTITPVALAGPAEDALKQCVAKCKEILGIFSPPCEAGCITGYTIETAFDDDSSPKFHFDLKKKFPSTPLGRDTLYYKNGAREMLRVGLWEGCPPQCMTGVKLVKGRADVKRVIFHLTKADDFRKAKSFQSIRWTYLGEGKFNAESNSWELPWDTTSFTSRNGYIMRATFEKNDGKTDLGFGLAILGSAVAYK